MEEVEEVEEVEEKVEDYHPAGVILFISVLDLPCQCLGGGFFFATSMSWGLGETGISDT